MGQLTISMSVYVKLMTVFIIAYEHSYVDNIYIKLILRVTHVRNTG